MLRAILAFLTTCALLISINCKRPGKEWVERYKKSARKDVDIFLVPAKYAVLESSWLNKTATARFDLKQLEAGLKEHGRSLADLKSNPAVKYQETDGIVTMTVGRISHSTAYDYDVDIPLAFYGKWFAPGEQNGTAHQQHIAPTLAKVLQVPQPQGSDTEALAVNAGIQEKPEIVVVAVIDQGGRQLLRLHESARPNIGRFLNQSANYVNAQVGHLDAHTAVGHMAVGTGAYPVKSTVIGNTFFRQQKGNGKIKLLKSEIYATDDETKVDTSDLKSETLADVLNKTTQGKSVVVSQSYALRAAIGMAGHGGLDTLGPASTQAARNNHVYWLDAVHSKWVTDTRFYNLPRVVAASDVLAQYIKEYPKGFEGYSIRNTKDALENWGVMMATPAETQLEGELIRAVITEEIIGKKLDKDGNPDLVYVSFKSADAVGHHFGYHSLEARETLREIDNQFGKLWQFLQDKYGDRFVLVLTADHGCAPLSEISGGARLTVEEVMAAIDSLLPPEVAAQQSLVSFMTVGQISLDHDLMAKHGITAEKVRDKVMALRPRGQKFFDFALLRKDLGLVD